MDLFSFPIFKPFQNSFIIFHINFIILLSYILIFTSGFFHVRMPLKSAVYSVPLYSCAGSFIKSLVGGH